MELVTFKLARARLGVHGATLRRWMSQGVMPAAMEADGQIYFAETEVRRVREALWSTGRSDGPFPPMS